MFNAMLIMNFKDGEKCYFHLFHTNSVDCMTFCILNQAVICQLCESSIITLCEFST